MKQTFWTEVYFAQGRTLADWAKRFHIADTWIERTAQETLRVWPFITLDRRGAVWFPPARSGMAAEPAYDPQDLYIGLDELLHDFDGVKVRLGSVREKMLLEIEESSLKKLPFEISECFRPFNAAEPSDLDAQMLYAAEYLCLRTPVHKIPQVKGHGFHIDSTSHPYRRICALLCVLDIPIPRRR